MIKVKNRHSGKVIEGKSDRLKGQGGVTGAAFGMVPALVSFYLVNINFFA